MWTPKGYDWVYRKFISDPVNGYAAVQAEPFENRHLLSKIGDFYERLKDSYDEKFYQQEVLGSYLSMDGGRVYSAFDRTAHIREVKVDPHAPLWWALDFNVDPMSSLIVQRVRGVVHVVGEIVIRHATTRQACEEFLKRYPMHNAGVLVFGDASGYQQQTTGATDYDMIREHFAVHANTKVEYRAPRVKSERAGADQPDKPAIEIGGGEHRVAGGPAVQGTDQGPGTGLFQGGHQPDR